MLITDQQDCAFVVITCICLCTVSSPYLVYNTSVSNIQQNDVWSVCTTCYTTNTLLAFSFQHFDELSISQKSVHICCDSDNFIIIAVYLSKHIQARV